MIELLPNNVARVSARLRELGWIKHSISSLEIAGDGNMNRTYRAYLDDGGTIIVKQSVNHVVKFPKILAPIGRTEVEAKFYAAIGINPDLVEATPKLLGYDKSNALLAMQDLGENSDFRYLYQEGNADDCTRKALRNLLRWLSALHGQDVSDDFPQNDGMRHLNHEHIFVLPLQTSTHELIGANFDPQVRALAAEMASDKCLAQSARALGDVYLGKTDFDSTPALLHGDFYPGSWLRCNSSAYVIDPEFAFVGPAEFDLGVFSAHLIFSGFKTIDIEDTLRFYDPPDQYDRRLAERFTGIEILRRLIGFAQLPLARNSATIVEWLQLGRRLVL